MGDLVKKYQIFTQKAPLRRSQNFNFLGSRNLSPGQILESSNSCGYH